MPVGKGPYNYTEILTNCGYIIFLSLAVRVSPLAQCTEDVGSSLVEKEIKFWRSRYSFS
jgi:hypothetical protein